MRQKAITQAPINSKPNGIILVAGKGHETIQIYKNKTLNSSDKAIIKKINIKLLKYSKNNYNQILNAELVYKLTKKKT